MIQLTDKQLIEYFHRSYTAADGLWFMKIEEKYGFDAALQADEKVWEIMPKIQARLLKPLVDMENELKALLEGLTTKLSIEGFSFKVEDNTGMNNFSIVIDKCPWHDLMLKSRREHLSGKIGPIVCHSEYRVWAKEFGDNITFKNDERICTGSKSCILHFSR
jgi:predicted ArsR family transcriptional regulator